jgi:hypothetical protein
MRTPNLSFLCGFLVAGAMAGCTTSQVDDDSMYLTGTEEAAVTVNGVVSCTNPKKALICHIPPGNPDNAHSICVSTHAVETHETHHGDLVGACAGDGDGDAPPPPAPPPPGDDGGGDGGPIN